MKPRRDITLGEMQDECNRNEQSEQDLCNPCKYFKVCPFAQKTTPSNLELSNSPRFNEAQQLHFWESWYGIGARKANIKLQDGAYLITFKSDEEKHIGTATVEIACMPLSASTTLDLAELLGKDKE